MTINDSQRKPGRIDRAPKISVTVRRLRQKGVIIPNPFSVEIGDEVNLERISGTGVSLLSGTRIFGRNTLICPGASLGYEAPVTAIDCHIGPGVELGGGFFKSSTFLARVKLGMGAQVREGCLLEEGARGGHTVGLKQTILFPFVTLGSLINFCDCLMAGGTSEKNHSEVGSSFVHFNYTPDQDKATASLLGDVPRGVMLKEEVIFLGGQGGLVGPVLIGYGVVSPAGVIIRKNCPDGAFVSPRREEMQIKTYRRGAYHRLPRIVNNNVVYIANLIALRQWYKEVRRLFFERDPWGEALYAGALSVINANINERLKRFSELAMRVDSLEAANDLDAVEEKGLLQKQRKQLRENREKLVGFFAEAGAEKIDQDKREAFLTIIKGYLKDGHTDFLEVVRDLKPEVSLLGTQWLSSIVGHIVYEAGHCLPAYPRGQA